MKDAHGLSAAREEIWFDRSRSNLKADEEILLLDEVGPE